MYNRVIFIDPGIGGTGYAVWSYGEFLSYESGDTLCGPNEYGVINCKDVNVQLEEFKRMIARFRPLLIHIEDAAFMPGSVKGQAAAKTGSVVKLAQYIGRLQQICADLDCEAELISVMKWKGTLPKKVVWDRIFKVLPDLKAKSHALDAIGLGLWKMGVINQGMKK